MDEIKVRASRCRFPAMIPKIQIRRSSIVKSAGPGIVDEPPASIPSLNHHVRPSHYPERREQNPCSGIGSVDFHSLRASVRSALTFRIRDRMVYLWTRRM